MVVSEEPLLPVDDCDWDRDNGVEVREAISGKGRTRALRLRLRGGCYGRACCAGEVEGCDSGVRRR